MFSISFRNSYRNTVLNQSACVFALGHFLKFIIISLVFFYLSKLLFSRFLYFKVFSYVAKITQSNFVELESFVFNLLLLKSGTNMATAFSKLHKVDRESKTSGKRNGCAAKEGEIFKKLLIIEKVVLTMLIKGARSQHFNIILTK